MCALCKSRQWAMLELPFETIHNTFYMHSESHHSNLTFCVRPKPKAWLELILINFNINVLKIGCEFFEYSRYLISYDKTKALQLHAFQRFQKDVKIEVAVRTSKNSHAKA